MPYDAAAKLLPTEAIEDIFSIAADSHKVFLGIGAVKFPITPEVATKQILSSATLTKQDDYAVGGRHEYFPKSDKELRGVPSEDLQRLAADMLEDWPQAAINLVLSGDSSFFNVGMYTSVPTDLDRPTNVTLLGDAVHARTPTLGRGANLAMRDVALLSRHLKAVAAGQQALSEAGGVRGGTRPIWLGCGEGICPNW